MGLCYCSIYTRIYCIYNAFGRYHLGKCSCMSHHVLAFSVLEIVSSVILLFVQYLNLKTFLLSLTVPVITVSELRTSCRLLVYSCQFCSRSCSGRRGCRRSRCRGGGRCRCFLSRCRSLLMVHFCIKSNLFE